MRTAACRQQFVVRPEAEDRCFIDLNDDLVAFRMSRPFGCRQEQCRTVDPKLGDPVSPGLHDSFQNRGCAQYGVITCAIGNPDMLRPDSDRGHRPAVAGALNDLADQTRQFAGCRIAQLDDVDRRTADKFGDKAVCRPVIDVTRRSDLLQRAFVQHRDTRGQRHRLPLIMRDEDDRCPELAVYPFELGPHFQAKARIKVRQRFVQQKNVRVHREHPRQRNALLLSAGQLRGIAVPKLVYAECLHDMIHPGFTILSRHPAQPQPEIGIAFNGQVGPQRVVLEDKPHFAPLGRHEDAGRDGIDDFAADADLSGGEVFQPRDHPQGRRLPAARRTEETHEFTRCDLKAKV